MEEYIKWNCRHHNEGTPFLYGNIEIWPWIETFCKTLGLEIKCAEETIVQTFKRDPLMVTLIQLKTLANNVVDQLSNVIDETKISLPWLDNRNVYASFENYQEVKDQIRIHKLTIVETSDYEVMWLQPQTVKLIRLDCEVPAELKRVLKLNPNLFSVNLSFAYPWHQFWYFTESPQIDRLVLDVCANYWSSSQILDSFDLIDLLQIQIGIRGPAENQYLYNRISRLIEQKLDTKSTKFNINTHLFDCDKAKMHEDTILYLIYQYGRRFTEIIWLSDSGTTAKLFDVCVQELNMKMRNHQSVEIDLKLKRYRDMSAQDLISRMWSSTRNFNYALKIADYPHFTSDLFLELVKAIRVESIQFDVGYHLNYFLTPGNGLEPDEISAGDCEPKTIRLTYKPRRSLGYYNGLSDFVCFFKRVIKSDYQKKFFNLVLDGVVIENWSAFSGLNILSVRFENMELSINDLEELSNCTQFCPTLEFHDCENLNDTMLLKLIAPNGSFDRIKITGKTSITRLFFYMRADVRMTDTDSTEYDFADETPVIETDQYDHIAESKYYKFERIVCYDDDYDDPYNIDI